MVFPMMTTCNNDPHNPCAKAWSLGGLALVAALVVAIRPESLWIDELSSAFFATQPDWTGVINCLGSLGSEAQMPFYVAWLWGWVHLFGSSEWILRASNIPWAVLAVACWISLLRRHQGGGRMLPLLVLPILCYYMNEARPYVMTFAAGLLALWGVEARCTHQEGSSPVRASVAVLAGVGICLGASMLNLILLPGLVVYATVRVAGSKGGIRDVLKQGRGMIVGVGLVATAMVAFYALTLHQGHGGQREPFSVVNGAYAVYEMLGFGGLGAPRIALREMSCAQVVAKHGVLLAIGVAVWGGVVITAWRGRRTLASDTACTAAFSGFVVSALGLATMAVVFKVGLWGRHFMAVIPLFYWGMVCVLARLSSEYRQAGKWLLAALVCVFLVSATRQRVLDEYRKDPLREALQTLSLYAAQAPGRPALVLAYPLALWYYSTEKMGLISVAGWPEAKVLRWQRDHDMYYILVHRADKVDPQGIWVRQLETRHATEVWKDGNARIFGVCMKASGKDDG